jgi:hypothetical protein
MNEPRTRDLLAFLDSRLNDLMFSLYRSRQTLTAIQQHAQADAALLGHVGEALAAVRESERMLGEIQQRITSVWRDA